MRPCLASDRPHKRLHGVVDTHPSAGDLVVHPRGFTNAPFLLALFHRVVAEPQGVNGAPVPVNCYPLDLDHEQDGPPTRHYSVWVIPAARKPGGSMQPSALQPSTRYTVRCVYMLSPAAEGRYRFSEDDQDTLVTQWSTPVTTKSAE
jgi:hypothetical protein